MTLAPTPYFSFYQTPLQSEKLPTFEDHRCTYIIVNFTCNTPQRQTENVGD